MAEILLTPYQRGPAPLILGTYGSRLVMCDWTESARHPNNILALQRRLGANIRRCPSPAALQAADLLDDFFKGATRHLPADNLMLAGTPFQVEVWRALLQIPYGQTRTYADVARAIGRPRAVRAVASAVAANPLSLFVPCHRVVRSDATLGGYAGTPAVKSRLLTLETNT